MIIAQASAQPVIINASFEADAVPPGPGYSAISGWTPARDPGVGYGINGAGGTFADNGAIPDGTNVAFIQDQGTLSQAVSGFTVGAQYHLTYRENARFGCCGGTATLAVNIDGSAVIAEHTVASVGGAYPYRTIASEVFLAVAPVLTVTFAKGGAGDVTVLIDDVKIDEIPPNTPPTITQQPQSQRTDIGETVTFTGAAVGSAPMFFQWRLNGIDLAGRTNAALTLTNLQPSHAGGYSFVVRNAAGSTASALATLTVRSDGPALTNPGFEWDVLPPYPGYGSIAGWTAGQGMTGSYGLNEANGAFADNGQIPQGTRVAFLQANGALSQNVSGFVVGEPYWLTYRESARGNCCGDRVATLSVLADDTRIVTEHPVAIVGGTNPYRLVTSQGFLAPATNLTITFVKGGTGDSTALIDDVRILARHALKVGIAPQHGHVPAIHVEGIPNRMMTLEYKNSVLPGPWQELTNFMLTSGSEVVVDSTPPASGPRFYRARQTP